MFFLIFNFFFRVKSLQMMWTEQRDLKRSQFQAKKRRYDIQQNGAKPNGMSEYIYW